MGRLLIHWPCFAGKQVLNKAPGTNEMSLVITVLILNRARSMLCGYEIYSMGEMESFFGTGFSSWLMRVRGK